ncbi:MAG: DUF5060 domain-containing protein, partial [Acidobacteriia bacterium]|nr:DUF5060 domain-containing protein [Terriglobia bacterium]
MSRVGRRAAIFLLVLASALSTLSAQEACNNTPAYSTCDMVFELSSTDGRTHANPYADVNLQIEFRSPRHRTISIPGFWDGGQKMVVRFAPTEPGEWAYLVTSNVAAWEGKTGTFTAAASEAPGFVRLANVHHWAYTERNLPHLWMGATELDFASLEESAFRALTDARAAQKFNHLRGLILGGGSGTGFTAQGLPDPAYFRRLEERIRYLNQKGIVADLIFAAGPGALVKLFPNREQRRLFVRYVAGRYDAFNVTWEPVAQFEDYLDARAV